ncbi:MAG: PQQ-binding-like beta-propeller repeat protein [Bacteroidales bacterium]|nr:PQQ-binding-like beta-propeller repeat protein [Bacteroidales bacterium]
MKFIRRILPGLIFFISWQVVAQPEQYNQACMLHIKLKDGQNQAVPSFVVRLTDKANNRTLDILSDKTGKLEIPVEAGHAYTVKDYGGNFLGDISIPQRPTAPLIKTIIVSKPASFAEKPYDTVVQQSGNTPVLGNTTEADITIKVLDLDLHPQKDLVVRLVCDKYLKVWVSITDGDGAAHFRVLIGGDYNLGIQESENLRTFKVPAVAGYALTAEVPYHPTNITERIKNDTVYQEFIPEKRATFSRAFLEVTVKDYERLPLPDEDVFLDVAGKPTVYAAKTDQQGKAYFLLPYGFDYSINLTYERDIFPLNYPLKEGVMLENEAFISYRGTAKIREFFKNARRDQHGFVTEFMPVEVKKIGFDPSNVQITKHGYLVNFPAKSETPTPAILENGDVIQGGGYYSREVYSFKSKTGLFNWGLELSDNGVSASVCDENFLVITTESCTLYAIDAGTGELAWSKWLGPSLNSTPTVADGKCMWYIPRSSINISLKRTALK